MRTSQEGRALVLAPSGRDAEVAVALLAEAGIPALACRDAAGLMAALREGAALLVATEEALLPAEEAEPPRLLGWLDAQPPWSDLPVIVLARPGAGGNENDAGPRLARALGNATLIERPFHPSTLVGAARAALRARRRQYQARTQIEARERDAAALRDGEARLRLALRAGGFGAWELDTRDWSLRASPECRAIFGIGPGERFDYATLLTLIHPDDLPRQRAAVATALASGREFGAECRVLRPGGALGWVEVHGQAVPGSDPPLLAGVSRDISARRRAEDALRSLNHDLEARVAERSRDLARIFDLSLDVLVICGFDGRFRAVSPAWQRITGRGLSEATARPFLDFVHPDDRDSTRDAFATLLRGQRITGFENRFQHLDGSWRDLSWRAEPLAAERQVYCIARDVTEDKAREAALDSARRLEALGQLTGGVAHDFNNLLQVLGAGLETLERVDVADPARRARFVSAMRDAVRRGGALTRQLLAFARRQALRPEAVDVAALVNGSLRELLERSLRGDVGLVLDLPRGLWPALVDAGQLEAALLNLAVNARDAMPGGGTLTLSAGNAVLHPDPASRDAPVGEFLRIAVSDTGTGMSPEVLARVFEPFFTTKGVGAGSGLGLAQVHGFVRQSGGTVSVSSILGQGSTVVLLLPRAPEVLPEGEVAGAVDGAAGAGARVLVVEDDEAVGALAAESLRVLGHAAERVSSPAEALALLADPARPVDLLFTDVLMPGGMDGLALVEAARRARPGLPALLCSGYSGAPARVAEAGLLLLSKPYGAEELRRAVRAALSGEAAEGVARPAASEENAMIPVPASPASSGVPR